MAICCPGPHLKLQYNYGLVGLCAVYRLPVNINGLPFIHLVNVFERWPQTKRSYLYVVLSFIFTFFSPLETPSVSSLCLPQIKPGLIVYQTVGLCALLHILLFFLIITTWDSFARGPNLHENYTINF